MERLKNDLILREKLAVQRTHLANQTTFLSFLRSSMYFLVAGLTIHNLADHLHAGIFEIPLFSISAILLVTGVVNYFRNYRRIKKSERHIGGYKTEYEESGLSSGEKL